MIHTAGHKLRPVIPENTAYLGGASTDAYQGWGYQGWGYQGWAYPLNRGWALTCRGLGH